jgi:hypothetical protein
MTHNVRRTMKTNNSVATKLLPGVIMTKKHNLVPLVASGMMLAGALLFQPASTVPSAFAQARPTVAPLPTSAPVERSAEPVPTGGEITLANVATIRGHGMRAVVQWQGGDGRWYDVEGWRSDLNETAVSWWVAPRDSGSGPFRWAVYTRGGAEPVRTSPSFKLPGIGQRLQIHLAD